MTRGLRQLTVGCVLTLMAGTGVMTAPADAAAGSPPETKPDAESMFAGNAAVIDVLANDSDADGDDLAICRVGDASTRRFEIVNDKDLLVIISAPGVKPGNYTFTYYACDFSSLTPGTVTLTIDPEPEIKVEKLAGRPGKLKVKNPADFRIELLYGSFRADAPDGEVAVQKNSSAVITVHRRTIGWLAFNRAGEFLKRGRVKNIALPPGSQASATGGVSISPRMTTVWRAQ